jgi:hypothetical protein
VDERRQLPNLARRRHLEARLTGYYVPPPPPPPWVAQWIGYVVGLIVALSLPSIFRCKACGVRHTGWEVIFRWSRIVQHAVESRRLRRE